MARQARRLFVLSSIILPIIYVASCGQGAQNKGMATQNKSSQTDNLNGAAVSATVNNQNKAQPETGTLTSDEAPAPSSTLDALQAEPGNWDARLPPSIGLSNLPYYCDPRYYAPNIINNNRACLRFQPIPYIGYGLDRPGIGPRFGYGIEQGPGPLFPPGPIGYRIKDEVGRIGQSDDDDDNHRGRCRTCRSTR